MAQVIVIAGKSNTGKSSLLATLDHKSTFVVNCLGKSLPFEGWKKKYNKENKNIAQVIGYNRVVQTLTIVDKDLPHIKTVFIDDVGYVINTELMDRADEKNFDKYTSLANHMFQVVEAAKNMRDDVTVILAFHQEDSDDIHQSADIKIPGKMMKNYYHPAELSTVCVFTHVEFDDETDEDKYYLVVKKNRKYPLAKTPMGMFSEKMIEANLQTLLTRIEEYNRGENKA